MTEEVRKPTKEELQTLEQSIIAFYRNSRQVLKEMREIFVKLGSPHIANTLEAAIGSMDIDLTSYEKTKEEKKDG